MCIVTGDSFVTTIDRVATNSNKVAYCGSLSFGVFHFHYFLYSFVRSLSWHLRQVNQFCIIFVIFSMFVDAWGLTLCLVQSDTRQTSVTASLGTMQLISVIFVPIAHIV